MSSPLFNLNIEIMIYCDDIMLQNNEYSKVYIGDTLHLTTEKEPVRAQPLTLKSNSANTYTIHLGNGFTNVQYCKDWTGGSSDIWTNAVGDSNNDCAVSCNANQPLSIRANWINNRIIGTTQETFIDTDFRIFGTSSYEAYGYVNSLLTYTDYQSITSLANFGNNTFRSLFATKAYVDPVNQLISAGRLLLSHTTLSDGCYQLMFWKCRLRSSTDLPELPAMTLAVNCYNNMFGHCDQLTSIPSDYLPATVMVSQCYYEMFYYCARLASLPSGLLHSTSLATYCYYGMFWRCNSLTTIPSGFLPATTLANGCYYGMFQSCYNLTTVPSNLLPATDLVEYCYYQMFRDCGNLTTAPDLKASRLRNLSYAYMFMGCHKLNYIKCLATNITATNCTMNWVTAVDSTGTFVKYPSMSSWTTGESGIPSGWTVENSYN